MASTPPSLTLVVGGTPSERRHTADAHERLHNFRPAVRLPVAPAGLHAFRPGRNRLPEGPRLIRVDDLEAAFPDPWPGGVRPVLADPVYLLQQWVDTLDPSDRIIMTADRDLLGARAPDALAGRGPWRFVLVVEAARAPERETRPGVDSDGSPPGARPPVEALEAAELLFQGTRCRAVNDREGARMALDAALRLAPDWEAVHFEDGKFWLGADDIERARDAFARAANLMPTFSAALSNLGATLGELDQPEAALAAFEQAVAHDPGLLSAWNNIGVVCRELGRLDASARALDRVIDLAPGFVFGHYNLGHTRLLGGDYAGAVLAYEQGQRLDPDRNRRQACRLAVARFATGDVDGAERDLWRAVDAASGGEREDLLLEAYEIAHTLLNARPALAAHRAFVDRIARTLTV